MTRGWAASALGRDRQSPILEVSSPKVNAAVFVLPAFPSHEVSGHSAPWVPEGLHFHGSERPASSTSGIFLKLLMLLSVPFPLLVSGGCGLLALSAVPGTQ